MSQWHRENPELCGTDADPWMEFESYRKAILQAELECAHCGELRRGVRDGLCPSCWADAA